MSERTKFQQGESVAYQGGIYRVTEARTKDGERTYALKKVSGAGPAEVTEARENELAGELTEG